jgi:hypothetical protein
MVHAGEKFAEESFFGEVTACRRQTWSGINALVFIATLFVVPLLELEKRDLYGAVTGSVSLIKTVLGE